MQVRRRVHPFISSELAYSIDQRRASPALFFQGCILKRWMAVELRACKICNKPSGNDSTCQHFDAISHLSSSSADDRRYREKTMAWLTALSFWVDDRSSVSPFSSQSYTACRRCTRPGGNLIAVLVLGASAQSQCLAASCIHLASSRSEICSCKLQICEVIFKRRSGRQGLPTSDLDIPPSAQLA